MTQTTYTRSELALASAVIALDILARLALACLILAWLLGMI